MDRPTPLYELYMILVFHLFCFTFLLDCYRFGHPCYESPCITYYKLYPRDVTV
jgi:hypothetical protein